MLDFTVDRINYDTVIAQQQLTEQILQQQTMAQQQGMASGAQPVQSAPAGGQ